MTELAARLLPHGAACAGLREPTHVHLVLTGPGGGTWDVAVGVDEWGTFQQGRRRGVLRLLPARGRSAISRFITLEGITTAVGGGQTRAAAGRAGMAIRPLASSAGQPGR